MASEIGFYNGFSRSSDDGGSRHSPFGFQRMIGCKSLSGSGSQDRDSRDAGSLRSFEDTERGPFNSGPLDSEAFRRVGFVPHGHLGLQQDTGEKVEVDRVRDSPLFRRNWKCLCSDGSGFQDIGGLGFGPYQSTSDTKVSRPIAIGKSINTLFL